MPGRPRRHLAGAAWPTIANFTAGKWAYQRLLLLAIFFPFMRMLDAAITLYSVPAAWLSASNGHWKSPARRPVGGAATAALPAASGLAGGAYPDGTRNEPGTPARVAEASHVSG